MSDDARCTCGPIEPEPRDPYCSVHGTVEWLRRSEESDRAFNDWYCSSQNSKKPA